MRLKHIATLIFAVTAVFPAALLQAQELPTAPPESQAPAIVPQEFPGLPEGVPYRL